MAYRLKCKLINKKENTEQELFLTDICERFGLDYRHTYLIMFSRVSKTYQIDDTYSVRWERMPDKRFDGFNVRNARDQIEVGKVYTITTKRDDEYIKVKRRCIGKYPNYAIFENLANKCRECILYFDLARTVKGVVK